MSSPELAGEGLLPQKVQAISEVLERHAIPYAFGGAIALGYHAEPRATDDIDLNILLTPDRADSVLSALDELFEIPEREERLRQLSDQDQTRLLWDKTYVDLFFMDTAFHESLAGRTGRVEFGDREIPIISAEDLVVCKALFNRPHDWSDIARVGLIQGEKLDKAYVERWLEFFVGTGDPILDRFRKI